MIKRISLSSLRSNSKDPTKIVKYSTCNKIIDDDLDEVAVISNAAPESVRYGSGHHHSTANGPRVVPGIITAGVDRSKLINSPHPSTSVIIRKPSSVSTYDENNRPFDNQIIKTGCPSNQSLIQQNDQEKSSISSAKGRNIQTKKRSINHGANTTPTVATSVMVNRNDCENISKKTREQRRREIKKEFEKWENAGSMHHKSGCNWSFVFDPSGRLCYYWSLIVSIAFLYNFWTIIYRCAFQEISGKTVSTWFALDYFSDFIYVLDIAVNFRTGYLEEGVLQTDSIKLRQHYMNCTMFYIDCLCLLPLDFLYLSIGFKSILRCFRLVKIYRFWAFLDRTERHTNYPNIFRTLSLLHYILAIFHWNACLSHIIHIKDGFGSRDWFTRSKNKDCEGVTCDYLHAMYWSVLALTTIGDLPTPRNKSEYLFLIMQLVFGLFLFATVLGHVANIVTNVSAARKEFQAKLDAVKTYMRMRRVPDHIQTKVIRWFDYLWMTQKSSDEERSVGCLPDKLKAEIAIHVHLDTLKRVEIFQNTEAGFLCELVLRLRPVLFSPGDYICRKGEVGKEMYIVNRGRFEFLHLFRISSILYNQNLRLQVVTDNGKTVLATLRAGSYFGEISILNMGTAGNRRTASVRSVGYSDLFCLNKQDMWDVLKDYPAARVRLEAIAVKRLEKYRKEPLKKIAMGRSKSTPGLVESKGKIPMSVEIQLKENQSASTATLLKEEPDIEERIIGKNRFDQDGSDEVAIESASSVDTMKASSSRDGQQSSCDSNTKASGSHPYQSPLMNPSNNPAPQTLIYSHLLSPNVALVNFDSRSPQSSPLQHANLYSSSPMPTTFFQAQHFHPFGGSPVASNNQLPISSLSSNAGPIHSVSVNNSQSCAVNNNNSVSEESAFTNIQIEFPTQDSLLSEIKRLRGRLLTLETENVSMSMKLNQQQWQVENRLAEIEHQISSAATTNPIPMSFMSSNSSNASAEDNERNRESII